MHIKRLEVERYKAYRSTTALELRPLTILVGGNSAGKSSLSRAIPLLAGGLSAERSDEPLLPLESFGVRHGATFEDLITDRAVHGSINLRATFDSVDLAFEVQNVISQRDTQNQVVQSWEIEATEQRALRLDRIALDAGLYRVAWSEKDGVQQQVEENVSWQGLRPTLMSTKPWLEKERVKLASWATGVRYLSSPRQLIASPFALPSKPTASVGFNGQDAPLMLASSDGLLRETALRFRKCFGARLDVWQPSADVCSVRIKAGTGGSWVSIEQAGQGLSQVLPVVVQCVTAIDAASGVDILEHPESELHPQAHAEVADLILDYLPGRRRPVIVETHSEVLLLRVRRRIAEGRLEPEQVAVYWIDSHDGGYAEARQVQLTPEGEVDGWPEGVFLEDYEEIIAIRRAARVAR